MVGHEHYFAQDLPEKLCEACGIESFVPRVSHESFISYDAPAVFFKGAYRNAESTR
ncbi:MAG: hypothetical protein HC907_28725 [Richelia sp. SM1_7_0]|nr:hypothetical protein [Richelia sp. SM2_1_7]NJM22409.1 hypothetical protein [Richelia sp. SM1_7_0]